MVSTSVVGSLCPVGVKTSILWGQSGDHAPFVLENI